jgi:hypothetical protein
VNQVCVNPDLLLSLLDEIGRHRALADHETDLVEAIVCRGHRSRSLKQHWTARLDRKLLEAAKTKGGVKRFAAAHNLPPQAAYDRLYKLRKAKATQAERARSIGDRHG